MAWARATVILTHFGVMANHGGPAGSQANIELKTVAAMLEGKVE